MNRGGVLSRNCKMLNEQQTSQKRQVAYKVRIKDISEGQYVRVGGWEPNYVILGNDQKVSRINLIGTVVAKENANNYQSFLMDDGSGRISVRSFQDSNISIHHLPNLIYSQVFFPVIISP